MSKKSVHDVFTPTKPARLCFVERDALNSILVTSIQTPGKQIIVYGHSGSGKTTLLANKLEQLYETHVTTRCMGSTTFEQLILDAFDQLSPYYQSESVDKVADSVSASIAGEYLGIKSSLGAASKTSREKKWARALPPQLTAQSLARFLGVAGACWVLEDFHKAPDAEKHKISQMMKVFMDSADDFPNVKIIAVGAVDTAREVIAYDQEMRNRVAEIRVPLMTPEEITSIIDQGQDHLNVRFASDVRRIIRDYSNGLAGVCHQLCLNTCREAGILETASSTTALVKSDFELAISLYLAEASDTLKATFDRAFKQERKRRFDNARLIVRALSEADQEGAFRADIYRSIKQVEGDYPQGNLTTFLRRLTSEEYGRILRYDSTSGRYSFSDPIYRAMALAMLHDEEEPSRQPQQIRAGEIPVDLNWDSIRTVKWDSLLISVNKLLAHGVWLTPGGESRGDDPDGDS